MIFITLGSQKFQFNRLLAAVDKLIENQIIKEDVFAQTGYSDYIPRHYNFQKFLNRDEYASVMGESDMVITHGGTGAIIGAVKLGKKVIAVPRLKEYGEHVDDHQLQIVEMFEEMNLISGCRDCGELHNVLEKAKSRNYDKYKSNTQSIIDNIAQMIDSL